MPGGLQLEVNTLLPVPRLARLAVDYANLSSLEPASLRGLLKSPRQVRRALRFDQLDLVLTGHLRRPKLAAGQKFHTWIRELMEAATESRRLSEDDDTALYELVADYQPVIQISYQRGAGFDASLELPHTELAWYIALGCAALVDWRGRYRGLVKRCDNFAGSEHVTSVACGGYVLLQSEGGRKPSRFCSRVCQNRVNQRKKDRARRLAEKIERP